MSVRLSGEREGGGGGMGRERPIFLGANKPNCYPNAEVEITPPGLFLPNFIYMLLLSNFFKTILKEKKLHFKITLDICAEVKK